MFYIAIYSQNTKTSTSQRLKNKKESQNEDLENNKNYKIKTEKSIQKIESCQERMCCFEGQNRRTAYGTGPGNCISRRRTDGVGTGGALCQTKARGQGEYTGGLSDCD